MPDILKLYGYIYLALTALEFVLFAFGFAIVATTGFFRQRHSEPGDALVGFVVGTVVFVLPANIGLAGVITVFVYVLSQLSKLGAFVL